MSALCADVEPQARRYTKSGHYRFGSRLDSPFQVVLSCRKLVMTTSIRPILRSWWHHVPVFIRVRNRLSALLVGLLRQLVPAGCLWGPPKGFYSEYELLLKKQVPGKVIIASQERPRLAPNSLRELCRLEQDQCQPWPIFWTCRSQVRLIGRSLVRLDGQKRLSLEAAYGPVNHKSDPAYRNMFLPKAARLDGNWTSVVDQWGGTGYYHWFLDALTHLIMLPDLPPDTRVIVPPRLDSYQMDTLRWLGLQDRIRPTGEKHLLVENYYFCSPTSMTGCYNPFGVRFLRRSFLSRADKAYAGPRRFYLRRVGKARPITNEGEVLEFFRKRGWDILDIEPLTQAQKIQLFAQAEMICAPHGAGLTNLLWCQPGCKVLELCASTFLNGVFEGLAQCVEADYRYLVFKADAAYRSSVDLKAVATALEF
jgi:capsular polysaccharide biosynthesis protein